MIDYKISFGTAGNSDIPERYEDLPSHNIEVFQSENIQNIIDAKSSKHECVEIEYIISKLNNEDIANYKKLLGSDYFKILKQSFEKCESQDIADQVERVQLALKNEDKWYSLTIIEQNTIGLLGDETGREKGSNYNALMRHSNKSEKEGISGGTFGKGSSVYTFCSGLWLWFAYSVLEIPWKNTRTRFIGRGMIAPFTDYEGNRSYNGPIWYARKEKREEYVNNHPQQGLPFTNEDAHSEAAKFKIPIRNESHPGTTYLIPVFWPDGISPSNISENSLIQELKTEIIKRWFIPIYNGLLKCKIMSETEGIVISLEKNDLLLIPELKHKLDILDWYQKGDQSSNKIYRKGVIEIKLPILKKAQQKIIAQKYKKVLGNKQTKTVIDLVIKVLQEDDANFTGFKDEDGTGTVNKIALTRNKGMIVNHYPYEPKIYQDFVEVANGNKFEGILFAGKMCKANQSLEAIDHAELFLSYAENPAHNEWIYQKSNIHRCNLKRFEENINSRPENRVNSIFTKIFSIIADFFPKDEVLPLKKDICSFWKKLYRLPSAGDSNIIEHNFSYEVINEGLDSEGCYFLKLKVKSKLIDKKLELIFTPYLNTLEGQVKSSKDFGDLGIFEFGNLTITENGEQIRNLILEPVDSLLDSSRIITVKTSQIKGISLYKNLDPAIQISDIKL